MAALSKALVSRFSSRAWYILAFAVVALGLAIAGQLAVGAAFVGLLAFTAMALAIPARSDLEVARPKAASRKGKLRRRKEPPLELTLGAFPEPVVLVDMDGAVVMFNHAARDLFAGLTQGRAISALLRDPDFLQVLANTISSREPAMITFGERVPVSRRIRATMVPLLSEPDGKAARKFEDRIMIVFHDLTAREALDQMRTDFIANASHELRTPLASVSGFIETLRGSAQNDPEARDRFLSIMSKQADRMARLINDLMSLSRVEMNAHLYPTEQVDLKQVLADVRDALVPIAEDAGIDLSLKLSGKSDMRVRGERDELVQVFQNLVQNGIKYGNLGGSVRIKGEVETFADRKRVVVRVIDDGVGIAAEHLPRLTERFYRVNVASSREKGGTGLGLAIVKHIVRRHRGELKVRSTLGEGSEFEVMLPGL